MSQLARKLVSAEQLIVRFSEPSNEAFGEHVTTCAVTRLMVNLPSITDECARGCGTVTFVMNESLGF